MTHKYPWMPWEEIEELIGRKKPSPILQRFLDVYKMSNDPDEMYVLPVDDDTSRKITWGKRRDDTISRILPRYMNNPTQDMELTLNMWAFDPFKHRGISAQ